MKSNSECYFDKKINLKRIDLLFYYARRWKSLLILIIIMIVVGCVLGQYVRIQQSEKSKDDIQNYPISFSSKLDMDNAYRYQKLYDRQREYMENSIYMNLDPNQTYRGTLKYYVNAGRDTAYYGTQLSNLMTDADILEELKNIVGCTNDSYILELAGATMAYPSSVTDDGSDVVKTENMAVIFWFYASDETTCQKMLDVVREKAESLIPTFKMENGYSFPKVEESVNLQMSSEVRIRQTVNSNLLVMYSDFLESWKSVFSDKQQDYYDIVYLGKDVSTVIPKISTKKVLGIIAGCASLGILMWLFGGLLGYILDEHVKTAEEIEECYHLRMIGRYCPQMTKRGKLSRWYENIRSKKLGTCNDENYFSTALSLLQERLCVIGNANDDSVRELGEKVAYMNSNITYCNLMREDSSSIQRAKEAGGVVLLVHSGVSTYLEVFRELEICSLQNVLVAGAIVIE